MTFTNIDKGGAIDELVLSNTLVGYESLKSIVRLSTAVRHLEGSIAEVGVYNGGSALLLCKLNPQTKVYLFDTFKGLPATNSFDNTHKKGDFNDVSERNVKKLLSGYENCELYKGVFPLDTGSIVEDKKFKLVHLDVDVYQSYRDSLHFFYPRLVSGGIIVMDDYGSAFCLGAKKAVDEFMSDKLENLIIGPERQSHFIRA